MRLRNRVRLVREKLGVSQHELSRQTGLSRMTIRAVERDNGYVPNGSVMTRLSDALGETDLFWFEDDATRVEAVA
jgi:transcriptional regulator with XRE-family HTH domain